jgi:hypothetical protein
MPTLVRKILESETTFTLHVLFGFSKCCSAFMALEIVWNIFKNSIREKRTHVPEYNIILQHPDALRRSDLRS